MDFTWLRIALIEIKSNIEYFLVIFFLAMYWL
jgi:hypothetical protein